MRARPHRFLQYLQDLQKKGFWHEVPALEGRSAGKRQSCSAIKVEAPGRALREIHLGIRGVFKWVVRLLYLSPLFIALRYLVSAVTNREVGDSITVAFVGLVVSFFVLLNLYIFWAALAHFRGKGALHVRLPFTHDGADSEEVFAGDQGTAGSERSETVRKRGVVVSLGDTLPGGTDLVRDLWAVDSAAPWRLTEVMDFAVLVENENPLILSFNSAPVLIAKPEKETVSRAVERMTPGVRSIFDLEPALKYGCSKDAASFLSLSEGDEVELIGVISGSVPNIARFELGSRICSLVMPGHRGHDPYRGSAGQEGVILRATPSRPIWIRRVSGGVHSF